MPFTILAQAEEKLQYEKHEWLQSHILHRELQEIILDYELQAHDTALSTADKEFKEILEQSLTYAETFDYLLFNPDPSSQVTLLGLSPEDIESHNPYNMHLSEATEEKERDLHRIALALNAYAAIGSGFDELVEEYGKLKAEMDNKRWALQEFQRTN
ncbi:hypothetical protein C0Q70_18891 [Pomacea canaliculata]|uniref:Uncharacterized protein n=1 Tax=Pomacea canaliculata TaxID=400727 RepID=A0A2T7NHS5_POMCA|nr:hypothetical protein C0Q70_18891 [Pomacea canaliculata]